MYLKVFSFYFALNGEFAVCSLSGCQQFFQNSKLTSHCSLAPTAAGEKSDVSTAPGPLHGTRCSPAGSFWKVQEGIQVSWPREQALEQSRASFVSKETQG